MLAVTPLATSTAVLGFVLTRRNERLASLEIRILGAVVEVCANAFQRAMLFEQTEWLMLQVQALHAIDTVIAASTDLSTVMSVVLSYVVHHTQAESACVFRYHPASRQLTLLARQSSYLPPTVVPQMDSLTNVLTGCAIRENRLVEFHNLAEAAAGGCQQDALLHAGFLAYAAVPLVVRGEINGVLKVHFRSAQAEDRERSTFLTALAQQTAIAIDSKTLFASLQSANFQLLAAYDSSIYSIAQALDLRDHETEGHSRWVTTGAETLARAMGVSDSDLIHLRRGALLHDFGKLGIPDHILLKPGPLTDDIWVLMRQHPVLAYEMLKPVAYLAPTLHIPCYHQEKWDGSGYPAGLKGENIPEMARIFAVIDVWTALTMDRPYRRGWSREQTRGYITEQSGRHFDPRVVDVFLRLPEFMPASV